MVWAPDVFQRDDGRYIMFYSAVPREDTRRHCLGWASASAIEGPYTPSDSETAWACPLDKGGAIDAAGFRDSDGTLYITYKVDGSALNTDENYHPTPLVLQEVKDDGHTPDGEPVTLLDRIEEDGPLTEAPSIVKVDGTYYLLYSSHMFNSPDYDAKFATAPSVAGPYTRVGSVVSPRDPSDVGPLSGPGGADISEDGTKLLFHANLNNEDPTGGRGLYATGVSLKDGKLTLLGGKKGSGKA
ncbi:glycosyl hydrolase [Aspergillus karnatakaensis]|uniref:glycoside hydrolase family 43 protein n=1 Tax=Aspergillus karnatakaensis TaxID=1810916 RepID=UPI003CCD66FB